MRILLLVLIGGALLLAPFVVTRRPWAVKTWQRVKMILVVYCVVIFVSAVVWLITRWGEWYG
jgi:hypothetical protein